jgi:hypothetical protein
VDVESDIVQANSINDPDCPELRDVSATPKVLGLFQPTWKLIRPAEIVLVSVNAIETRRNKRVKKM